MLLNKCKNGFGDRGFLSKIICTKYNSFHCRNWSLRLYSFSARILALFSRTWLIDFLVLFACLSFFYWVYLGSFPLFIPDEGRYAEISREMLATKDFITPRVDGIPF